MKRLALCLVVVSALLLMWSPSALGYNVYVCGPWSASPGPFVPVTAPDTHVVVTGCGGGVAADMQLWASGQPAVPNGQGASWSTSAPADLSITHIYTVNDNSGNIGDGHGWWGEFVLERRTRAGRTQLPNHTDIQDVRVL